MPTAHPPAPERPTRGSADCLSMLSPHELVEVVAVFDMVVSALHLDLDRPQNLDSLLCVLADTVRSAPRDLLQPQSRRRW
jgi:hypothetical protein